MALVRGIVVGGRYRLDEQIATGGMGAVWRATDEVLDRAVAVKVLHAELGGRAGFLERFRREARNLAKLAHPSIATVFDYGEHEGSPYLVMELVAGEDLARLLARQGALPTAQALHIVQQAAAGLAVAHGAGVVHRDIKPANLMITDHGQVKITDFGISRLVDSAAVTATNEVLGTPQYMAPEQLSGAPAAPVNDVYALAAVGYELLTGRPPFVADTAVAVALAQVRNLAPPLPEHVPRPVADLIGRALSKDPLRRPADGRAMVDELERIRGNDARLPAAAEVAPTVALPFDAPPAATAVMTSADVGAVGPAPPAPLIGPLRRHRTKRLAAVAVVAVLVVGVLAAIALSARDDGGGVGAVTDPAGRAPTTAAAPPTAPTTPATAPATTIAVVLDPAAFIGRDRDDVAEELRQMGFDVDERSVDVERGVKKNTVVAIEPSGAVTPGSTIEISVAHPGKGREDDDDDD